MSGVPADHRLFGRATIETGTAVSTGRVNLPARWVIHAVGPVWDQGGQDKLDLLATAYASALPEADALGAKLGATAARA